LSISTSIEHKESLQSELTRYKESHRYLEILNNFSQRVFEQKSVEDICWSIAKNAVAKLGFEDCVVYILDENNHYLVQKAAHGPKNPIDKEILNPINIAMGVGVVGEVALTGIPVSISDTGKDHRYIEDDRARASEISVPLIVNDKVIGVIDSENARKNFFTQNHLNILTSIASIAAIKIDEINVRNSLEDYKLSLEDTITKRTEEINSSMARLSQSNENLRQFGYFISHDLREPLRNITTYLNLIKRYLSNKENQEVEEMMTFALEGAHRMDTLINNIQAFTLLGRESSSPERINLPELILSLKHNLSVLILENNATVVYSGLDEIVNEKALISVVLQNLIQNAIKYKHADRYPEIKIEVLKEDNYLRFNVSDNGIGIDKENQNKIFDLFGRIKSTNVGGSGIGLATCKRIVDHLDGLIVVSSVLGVGSVFSFSIPILDEEIS